ncbi:MAG: hypothetical protein M5U19_11145 [Microthrixaceae bacterium]|nr:hypothetical protein [Microthrixaceae bacterium]
MGPPRYAVDSTTTDETASGYQSTTAAVSSWALLAPFVPTVVLVMAAAWIGRRLWFFSDDWNILAGYHSGNLTEAFNGHLTLVPAGIYQLLFHTAGVESYLPYRLAGLLSLVVLGFQVARWTMSWVGPVLATLAVTAVMWNSSGASNVMFPFLMNFSLPIAALLAIWWHLDRLRTKRDEPTGSGADPASRADLVAIALWMSLALATSGLGVMTAAAVAVELLLRRAPVRQWIAWGAPTLLWAIWWVGHRDANEISTDMAAVVPYALRMLLAGATAVAAGWKPLGVMLAAALVAGVVAVTIRRRSIDPRVAGALFAALAFATLTSLTRQDTVVPIPPDELRYGWTVGAYLVLAAVALAGATRGAGDSGRRSDQDGTARPMAARASLDDFRTRISSPAIVTVAAVLLAAGAIRLTDGMRLGHPGGRCSTGTSLEHLRRGGSRP